MRLLNRMQPLALLVLRLGLGAIMIAHGYPKIFHGGAAKMASEVTGWGWPWWMAYVSACSEFFGGLGLVFGFLTRLASLGVFINMSVAIWKVHLHNGLGTPNGFDFPMACAVIAFALIFFGPGIISVDHLIWGGGARQR